MAPFNDGIFKEKLIPEPEAATQAVYGDLDSVVEAVLTDPNANIPALLQAANTAGQASIARGTPRRRTTPLPVAGGRAVHSATTRDPGPLAGWSMATSRCR